MKTGCFLWGILLLLFSITVSAQDDLSFNDWESQAIQQPKKTVELLKKAQSALTQNQKLFLTATAHQKLGKLYKVDSIITTLFEQKFNETDSSLYIKSLALRSEQLRLTSNLKEALITLNKVIDYYSRNKDTINLISTYISLNVLYVTSGDYGFAKQSLLKAESLIHMYSKEESKRLLAILYDARIPFHTSSEFPESREFYALKSLEMAREIKDNHLIATACNQLGVIYYEFKPPDPRSEVYLKEAIAIWDTMGYDVYWLNGLTNLARYYGRVFRNQEALDLLLNQKNRVDNASFTWGKGYYYSVLGKIYAKLGQYEQAYLFKRKGESIRYEEGINKYKERLSIYTYKLEAKEKEETILKKEQQLELTDLKLKSEKKTKWLLYAILLAVAVILLGSLYSRFRITKQRNLLAAKNEEIEEKNLVISSTNDQLNKLVDQREALLKEVNHRVKNNLTLLSSLLFLQGENLKSEEAKVALHDSQLRINSISLIHESLYSREDMDRVNVQEYILDLFNQIKSIYWTEEDRAVNLKIDLKNYQTELKESVPIGMIFNELITNSFKYAFETVESPEISIQYQGDEIVYFDNGPGYEIVESSSSIGLQLVSVFASQLNASIAYRNGNGNTQTIIQLKS